MTSFMFLFLSILALLFIIIRPTFALNCPPFPCGDLGDLGFPFSNRSNPECGLYMVDCSAPALTIQFKPGGYWFGVKRIVSHDITIIGDETLPNRLYGSVCQSALAMSLPGPYSPIANLTIQPISTTLLKCRPSLNAAAFPSGFEVNNCGDYNIIFYPALVPRYYLTFCSVFQLPAELDQTSADHSLKVVHNFSVKVDVSPDCRACQSKGGQCRVHANNKFHCAFGQGKRDNFAVRAVLIGVSAAFGNGLVIVMLYCCLRQMKERNPDRQRIEAILRNCKPLNLKRYSYSDVKKMTRSFAEELGKGGFGDVFKGKLDDGSVVAVKVLKKSKGEDGEDFMNEVATVSRTSHVNVVTLLGFCFEGARRALIYEFMPNGSLEKFVFDENATTSSHRLNWDTHYRIAIGIARGLEYLHRGCNTRILHFDIKPHNILLDADFVPKISDFGLAKICPRKESIVSMACPRGTVGYIAPEVFNRNFGGASHKSDVYSYGMMVLEMVGGRKNINVGVDNTSEIYFPDWIYKRLELNQELGLKKITNKEDREKVRKMIIVSLWCIQTVPSNRPAISGVIEMLEGRLDSLQVPPKPFLYSPPRSPPPTMPFLNHD